jgi:hypothetical protein
MPVSLSAKLDKLEAAIPDVKPYPRVLRTVANNRAEADELARANGFHPCEGREDELIINHILVSPAGYPHHALERSGLSRRCERQAPI